jgi:nucleoside-diphosphate-sugar epimerase
MHPADGRVVSNFIVQALRGEPITLYGNGNQTRSFCYVDDMVTAIIAFMDTDRDITGLSISAIRRNSALPNWCRKSSRSPPRNCREI